MNYAYVRVSTKEQNEKRQIECLKKYEIDKWFSEKISGATMERPKLQEMLSELKSGDTVYITDFSRLARSTYDLLTMVKAFEIKGINLVSEKEKLDMSTPQGRFILTVLAAVYEFEREITKERQADGIAIAKVDGKYKNCGRKKKCPADCDDLIQQYVDGKVNKAQLAIMMNVSRPTLNRILKEYAEV